MTYKVPKLYTTFAKYYDRLESQYRDYEKDSRWISETLASNQVRNVLDVSCGTGSHVSKLSALNPGLEIFAMDSSSEMLGIAGSKVHNQEFPVLRADFLNFPFINSSFDASICMYWSLAGLDEGLALKLFRGLASILCSGGLLLFDVENAEGIKENLIDAPFIDSFFQDEEGRSIIRANYSRKIEPDLVDWHAYYLVEEDGVSELTEDRMTLRFYSRSQLERLLSQAGFETISVSSGPFQEYRTNSPSLYFIARKRREVG